jgi:hypothetical protein
LGLTGDEAVGRLEGNDFLDAREGLQGHVPQPVLIAEDADHQPVVALDDLRAQAVGLDRLDQEVALRGRAVGSQYEKHGSPASLTAQKRGG